jgi:hypothetical protein
VKESRDRMRSLKAEYLFTLRDPATGAMRPATARNVVAAKGASRYLNITHFDAVMPEPLDTLQSIGFFTGKRYDVYYPVGRYYEVYEESPARVMSWPLRCDLLFECIGWWPPDDPSTPPDDPPFCVDLALARPGYTARPVREQVDGVWCDVVERPGRDVIWLDPMAGFAIRRREVFLFSPPVPVMRYELSDHREYAPGVWLPQQIRRILLAPRRAASGVAAIDRDGDCRLVHAEVNRVSDDLFNFTSPPGTLVHDRNTGRTHQIPGGLDHFDHVLHILAGRLEVYRRNEPQPRDPTTVWSAVQTGRGQALAGLVLVLAGLNVYALSQITRRMAPSHRGSSPTGVGVSDGAGPS